MKLLLDAEVAERLRCSVAKVKKLRLTGKIAYVPGRPPLIDEADLEDFIAREKAKKPPVKEPPAPGSPEADAVAAATARRIWLLRRMRGQR